MDLLLWNCVATRIVNPILNAANVIPFCGSIYGGPVAIVRGYARADCQGGADLFAWGGSHGNLRLQRMWEYTWLLIARGYYCDWFCCVTLSLLAMLSVPSCRKLSLGSIMDRVHLTLFVVALSIFFRATSTAGQSGGILSDTLEC